MVQEPLASVLRSGRDNFNALFAEARRNYPKLEMPAFNDFVLTTLDPLMHSCPLSGGEVGPLVEAGYEIGLELIGEGLAGKEARGGRVIEEAWRKIAPANWKLVASAPQHFFAAISNAVYQLSTDKTCRVDDWMAAMTALANECSDLETWLKLGQVLAWRAGKAEWRTSALAVAAALPEPLALAGVGAPTTVVWSKVRARLEEDIWFNPSRGDPDAERTLRLGGKVGAFRGLGGRFSAPPLVAADHGRLFVRSGEQCWLLIADVFGHSFHNATLAEFAQARTGTVTAEKVRIDSAKICVNGLELPNPVPGKITSQAILPHTLAITSSVSHAVFLIAY